MQDANRGVLSVLCDAVVRPVDVRPTEAAGTLGTATGGDALIQTVPGSGSGAIVAVRGSCMQRFVHGSDACSGLRLPVARVGVVQWPQCWPFARVGGGVNRTAIDRRRTSIIPPRTLAVGRGKVGIGRPLDANTLAGLETVKEGLAKPSPHRAERPVIVLWETLRRFRSPKIAWGSR